MANIKSAKKRILVNRTKADRNKAIKSGVKTAIKKVYAAIDANDAAAAKEALVNGELSATVLNDNVGQAQAMMDLAYHLATDWELGDLNLEQNKYIWLSYKKLYR